MVSWSEDSTFALIYPWSLYFHLRSRYALTQQNWENLTLFLNTFRGDQSLPNLTVIQCKNRMKFLEETYKNEKQKVMESNGSYTSSWPYFIVMDNFLGPKYVLESPVNSSVFKISEPMNFRHPTFSEPVMHTSRPGPANYSERNFWFRPYTPMKFPDIPMPDQFRGDLTAFHVTKACEDPMVSRTGSSSNHGEKKRKFAENSDYKNVSDEGFERKEKNEVSTSMADLEKTRKECIQDLEFVRMKLFKKMDVELNKIRSLSESE